MSYIMCRSWYKRQARTSKMCDSDVCMTQKIPSGFPLVVHFKLIALCGLQVGKDTNYFPVWHQQAPSKTSFGAHVLTNRAPSHELETAFGLGWNESCIPAEGESDKETAWEHMLFSHSGTCYYTVTFSWGKTCTAWVCGFVLGLVSARVRSRKWSRLLLNLGNAVIVIAGWHL